MHKREGGYETYLDYGLQRNHEDCCSKLVEDVSGHRGFLGFFLKKNYEFLKREKASLKSKNWKGGIFIVIVVQLKSNYGSNISMYGKSH